MLRPGGILLNFDANWYGYLYDEEKREAYEQDRKNVESQSLEDHYLCTDIDAMERIARKVPLSHITRPQWDTEVMEETGFEEISWDTDVWEAGMERGGAAELRFHAHVYGDRTQKYGEVRTEMTDTVRDNGKREPFSLGGLTAARGNGCRGSWHWQRKISSACGDPPRSAAGKNGADHRRRSQRRVCGYPGGGGAG